jgi:hypothetical protein
MALSKDQILSVNDRPTETVDVPEWGGSVILRTMSGLERNDYDASNMKRVGDSYEADTSNMYAKLLSRCLIDEDGKPLFTEADFGRLGTKSAKVLSRLFDKASAMNGLGRNAEVEAGKASTEESSSTSD